MMEIQDYMAVRTKQQRAILHEYSTCLAFGQETKALSIRDANPDLDADFEKEARTQISTWVRDLQEKRRNVPVFKTASAFVETLKMETPAQAAKDGELIRHTLGDEWLN